MNYSVGIDLVSVAQVRQSLAGHGQRYLDRVFTLRERAESEGRPDRLAARFAAKEATMKALARERDDAIPWRSIAVIHDEHGRPQLVLSGAAAALAGRRGVSGLALSLSHESDHAAAVVLAEHLA